MVNKGEVPCLLGNGICPPTCINYEAAKRIYKDTEVNNMSSFERRLAVVFGDLTPGVTVVDVVHAMTGCANEAPAVGEKVL